MNFKEFQSAMAQYRKVRSQIVRNATPADNLLMSNKPKANQKAIDARFDGVKPFTDAEAKKS